MSKKPSKRKGELVGFVGVGFDNKDGEHRLTRNELFFLIGGSQETHERMQDTAIRVTEEIHRRGKPLNETPVSEVVEIFLQTRESQ